jgi:predicted SAM-dependent methyltransferase
MIGDYQKAYENNETALMSNPYGNELSRCMHNKNWLESVLFKKEDGEGKKLNIGCGAKILDGYENADITDSGFADRMYPVWDIPYTDSSVSEIWCEHVLEHVSHENASRSVTEWSRVLVPGGILNLFIPDLEECCRKFLESGNKETVNGFFSRDWYRYTIYGLQQNGNGVPASNQYHYTGFSRNDIVNLLEKNGFVVDYAEKY